MKEKDGANAGGRSLRRWEGLGWGQNGALVLERLTWALVESLLITPESSVKKRKRSQHVTRNLQEGQDGCHCCLQHHASISGGRKGGGKWKKRDIFPRNPSAAFCFNLIDQNWITGLPLAAREAGKSGTGFSRPVERRAHCLIKCSQSSAKRTKGACLPCPPMPVPRSAVSCPSGVCASLKNAQAATMPVWSLQVFYIIGH